MTSRSGPARLALAIAMTGLTSCSKTTVQAGLEVIVQTDLKPAEYSSVWITVKQQTAGASFNQIVNEPLMAALPTRFAIAPGASADQDVLLTVTAFTGSGGTDGGPGTAVVVRTEQVQVPTTDVAQLDIELSSTEASCPGTWVAGTASAPAMCTLNLSDAGPLPRYVPGATSFDAGTAPDAPDSDALRRDAPGDGALFDGGHVHKDATVDATPSSDGSGSGSGSSSTSSNESSASSSASSSSVSASSTSTTLSCSDGGATCGGICVNEQASPTNCGSCGHSCLGGDCVAGQCQPVTLAKASAIQGLAVDATNVYWTNSNAGQVMYCPISGCGGTALPLAASVQVYPQNILVFDGLVYWEIDGASQPGAIQTCVAGSENCTPTSVFSGGDTGNGLAVDVNNVYWADSNYPALTNGTLLKCSRVGCGNNPTTLATGQTDIANIVVDATNVYFTNGNTASPVTVQRCAIAGCNGSPTILSSGIAGHTNGLAVSGSTVYWTVDTGAPGWILYKCAVGGCGNAPSVVASGAEGYVQQIAVDPPSIYITLGGPSGQVLSCPTSGCGTSPTVLATQQGGACQVTFDDSYIYWGNYDSDDSRVQRLAK